MTSLPKALRRVRPGRRSRRAEKTGTQTDTAALSQVAEAPPIDIAPNDPILAYFQSATGVVDVDALDLESPAVNELREAGIKLVVPLVSQGELIGLLNLGPRLSERDYSADDRKLLENLAAQAAPALRVGQLVQEQEAEARTRERFEQELRVAQLIQQQFLPKELPKLGGWDVAAYYRPAREVGGDFYDFIELSDGRIGIVAGDVTDKGVPAALVMASTRSILRGNAERLVSPSKVLEHANELLFPDIPAHMFVTCLYAVLDPKNGKLVFANAGHNLPYVATDGAVEELRATGMPLGLMPGMKYEEKQATLKPGTTMLLHSDGLAEAHSVDGEMFGFPRLHTIMGDAPGGSELIDVLLKDLAGFTAGRDEQEDDITLVTVQRAATPAMARTRAKKTTRSKTTRSKTTKSTAGKKTTAKTSRRKKAAPSGDGGRRVLAEFDLPSESGNERVAMDRVVEAVQSLKLSSKNLERLKTAVSEATMNAIEHGNEAQANVPVGIRVLASDEDLIVQITDQGGEQDIPEAETPDIEAKLAGLQKPRGWGLFLIRNMVDDMTITSDKAHHTVELLVRRKGDSNGNQPG